jgi:AcrR family transcriptional regulator
VSLTLKGEHKREQVLDAAAALLARHGYGGTTLAHIASAVGTHAGSLYYYFESREALVAEVLRRGTERAEAHVYAALAVLPERATSKRRLETAITAHIRYMLEQSDYVLAGVRLIGQIPDAVNAQVRESNRAYGHLFHELIESAAIDGYIDNTLDLTAIRMIVFGAANWTPEWFDRTGSSSASDIAALVTRMIFSGLGPRRRSR